MNKQLSLEHLQNMSNADLTKVSSQITGRLNNEDWQQMIMDLRASGHINSLHEKAPLLLQRFARLEIDLDSELGQRSATAPLLSTVKLRPARPTPDDQQLLAIISSQDQAALMGVDVNPLDDSTNIFFSLNSMVSIRFELPGLDREERRLFLMLLQRDIGLTFLWTMKRWEQDYLVFIKEEFFTRVYGFSHNLEATARLTNESIGMLADWLRRCWFPRQVRARPAAAALTLPSTTAPEPSKTSKPKPAAGTANKTIFRDETPEPGKQPPDTPAQDDANPLTW